MAANSIQIVDRQKTIQIMQKECLEEREAEIYRTLLGPHIVSIHAPARGATPARRSKARTVEVSIHAPARGAT